jgi:hypothetical protein
MEVILGLLPIHVMTEAEAQAEIYRLMRTQQCRPKSTNFSQTKKQQDMEHEPILRGRFQDMHFTSRSVTFPEKC